MPPGAEAVSAQRGVRCCVGAAATHDMMIKWCLHIPPPRPNLPPPPLAPPLPPSPLRSPNIIRCHQVCKLRAADTPGLKREHAPLALTLVMVRALHASTNHSPASWAALQRTLARLLFSGMLSCRTGFCATFASSNQIIQMQHPKKRRSSVRQGRWRASSSTS